MSKKIKPTNHDSWVIHFHVGKKGTPLTVYLMSNGTWEVWFGLAKYIGLTKGMAAAVLGDIMLTYRGVSL